MKRVVFYSWQSDLPNATNRGFVQQALELAADKIAADKSVEVEPVIDRDTQGVAGSPEISGTIFAKIAGADVFVADVSIIAKPRKGRPTPNPNVMIELGYALRALTPDRVLMVFNEAYGKLEELPFDLKLRRVISYNAAESTPERAPERKVLAGKLETALKAALATRIEAPAPSLAVAAVEAIENGETKRTSLLRRALADILARVDAGRPKMPREEGTIEDLLSGINQSRELVVELGKLSEAVAVMADTDAALEMYRWFGSILERYDLPRGFSGSYNSADFDYYKFLGYEIFTDLVALLLRDRRWSILQTLLSEPIPIRYIRRNDGPGSIFWDRISVHAPMLLGHGEQIGRLSFPADLVNDRHTKGALATVIPFDDFLAADYFLYLRTSGGIPPNDGDIWRPWSYPYLEHVPMFIRSAARKPAAVQLAKTFGLPGIEELKSVIVASNSNLRQIFPRGFLRSSIEQRDIDAIGSVD